MADGNRKRRKGHSRTAKGASLEEIEEDSKSSPTLSTNKLPPANSCVTEETTEKPDHWRIRQSELQELSKHRPNEIESGSSHKKIAIEHEESDVQDIQRTTSLASSSSGYISAESLERQPQASAAEGQVGDCVRTVAETTPMPDLFGQDEDGDTFLHIAVVQGDQPLTEFFIQKMKSRGVDIYNKLRQTPLHLAVITHQLYIVRKLIEGGADINLMDRHGQTALHLACQEDDLNCVYAIRDASQTSRVKLRLDLKNSQGLTVLHVAILRGSKKLIGTILDMGADINQQDSNSGRTSLHHAVEAGKYPVVEYLITRGADVNKVTFAGNTPLHTASGREMDDMAKLLMTHGANVNIANREGDIPKVVRTSEQAKRQFRSNQKESKRRKR